MSRIQFRRIMLSLLTLCCCVASLAQGRSVPAPLVRLPALPDAAPAKAKAPGGPGLPQPMAATAAAVTPNPTSLFAAPFAHDYSTGGLYGDYGVYVVVYGDFRHNGTMDAAGLSIDGILTLMGNDGKGHFSKVSSNLSQTANTFVNIARAFAVDLDGDGWLDVVALDNYHAGYVVWKNKGGGNFADAVRTDLAVPALAAGEAVQANSMAVGDMDGDRKTDLAIAYTVSNFTAGSVRMVLAGLKGNGDGTFQAPVADAGLALPYAASLLGIELADMHNSGTLDVVANVGVFSAVVSGYSTYAVAPGTGSVRPGELTLAPPNQWTAGSLGRGGSFLVRDVDGDGKLDVFASPGIFDVYLLKGDGMGGLAKPQSVLQTDTINVGCTLGDFNRDGYLDAAVFSDGLINIFNGVGGGAFTQHFVHQYPGGYAFPPPAEAIDLNGDTVPDFTQADGFFNYLVSFLNDGTGNFASATAIRSSNTTVPSSAQSSIYYSVLTQGDFNGDGLMDVMAQEGTSHLDIGLNDGKGGFQFHRAISYITANTLRLNIVEPVRGDFDGDGFDDLVFASYNGVAVGLSDGKGGIRKWVSSTFPSNLNCNPSLAAAGDLDGDGKLDLVLPYAGDAFCGFDPLATNSGYFILKGDGTGAFTGTFTPGGTAYYAAHLADMNRDGKLDLLLDDVGDKVWNLTLIAGNGTGAPAAQPVQLYTPGSLIYDFAVNDLNGDGNPDVIVSQKGVDGATDSTRAGVVVLAGKGDLTVGPAPVFAVDGAYATSVTAADLNHDGRPDVVAALYPTSTLLNGLAIVRSNGDGTFQAPEIYPAPIEVAGHFNRQVYAGPFLAPNSTDIVLGGGNEYVPSVLFQNAANTTLQLTVNRTTAIVGDTVGMYVQLNDPFGNSATGNVSFLADGKTLGTASLQAGLASFSTASLPAGVDTVTASYAGDATHIAAVSNPVVVTVQAPAPDFSLVADGTMLSLVTGGSARSSLSIGANGSVNGTLSLSCIGLPLTVQCTFSPATSAIGPSQQASVQLSVTPTNYASLAQPQPFGGAPPALAGLFTLTGVFCLRKRKRLAALCAVSLVALTGLTGCGGDNKQVQTVNFTVAAQVVSGGTTVTHSIPMQVVVRQ